MRLIRDGLAAAALAVVLARPAPAAAADLRGDWLTEGASAVVRIEPCAPPGADRLCGRIVWLWRPRDDAGPPLIGRQILDGFAPKSPGQWSGGTIFNPEDGRTYAASLSADGEDGLSVEGCFLLICRKQLWRRPGALCAR